MAKRSYIKIVSIVLMITLLPAFFDAGACVEKDLEKCRAEARAAKAELLKIRQEKKLVEADIGIVIAELGAIRAEITQLNLALAAALLTVSWMMQTMGYYSKKIATLGRMILAGGLSIKMIAYYLEEIKKNAEKIRDLKDMIKKLAEGILTIRQRLEELYRQLVFKGSELEQLQSKLGVLTKNEEYWSKEFISWVNKAGASNEELKQLNLEIIAANIVIRSITNDINRIQARINALSSFQEGSVVPQGLGDLLGLLAVRRFELSVKQNRLANLISQHGC